MERTQSSLTKALLITATRRVSLALLAVVFLLSLAIGVMDSHIKDTKYQLSEAAQELAGQSAMDLRTAISRDPETGDLIFKKEVLNQQAPSNQIKNKEGQYSVTIKNDPKEGVSYYDPDSSQSFTIKPNFEVLQPRVVGQHVVIPVQNASSQQVLTFKGNGLKEDFVLNVPQGDSKEFSYTLDLPASLEARLEPNGEIGIYTGSDTVLFGQISYGSDKDKELVEKAQAKSKKDKLVFLLPAPEVVQAGGDDLLPETRAYFELSGKTLTVKAEGLSRLKYPLSIDPSVVATSATSIDQGNGDGNVDFASTSIQIKRAPMGKPVSIGPQVNYIQSRSLSASVAYNNRLYVIGGCTAFSTNCTTATNTVEIATINPASGVLGAWQQSASNNLPVSWYNHQAVVYNGYIYVAGGITAGGSPTINGTVYSAKINRTTGNLDGGWSTVTSLQTARTGTGLAAYNGYLYVAGGCSSYGTGGATAVVCSSTSTVTSIEYIAIKADGSLDSSWTFSSQSINYSLCSFISCNATKATAYNGKLYVGFSYLMVNIGMRMTVFSVNLTNGELSTLQASAALDGNSIVSVSGSDFVHTYGYGGTIAGNQLNSDGSIAAYSSGITGCNVIYKTYSYCTTQNNSHIQSFATGATQYAFTGGLGGIKSAGLSPISNVVPNNANSRYNTCAVAYGGYVYVIGGDGPGPTYLNNVMAAPLTAESGIGSLEVQTNTFTAARNQLTCQAYNGYLYLIGGHDGTNDRTDIQYAPINGSAASTSRVGSFTTASATLPAARAGLSSALYRNANGNVYLYAIGGCTTATNACASGSTARQQIYYGTINAASGNVCGDNAGSWDCGSSYNMRTATANSNNALYTALHSFSALVHGGRLYIVGGMTDAATRVNNVRYIDISSTVADGNIATFGNWQTANSMVVNANGRALHNTVIWNGYMYAAGGRTGTAANNGTELSNTEYAKINANGSLSTWTQGGNITSSGNTLGVSRNATVSYNENMYILSGSQANSRSRNVVVLNLINGGGGSANTINTGTVLPNGRFGHASYAYNGYIYAASGFMCADGSNPCSTTNALTDTVVRAPLGDDGSIGSWTAESNTLGTARYLGKLIIYNNTAYMIGGCNNTACGTRYNSVEKATVNPSDGSLGSWSTSGTTSFTTARAGFAAFQYNGRLYILGGCDGSAGATCSSTRNDVQHAKINSDSTLGSWSSTTSFSTSRWANFATAYAGYAYVGGGYTTSSSSGLYDTQYAPIDSTTGAIGAWTSDYQIMDKAQNATTYGAAWAVAENGFLHVTYQSGEILSAPIGSNGALNGPWDTSGSRLPSGFGGSGGYQGAVMYYNGRIYLVGGIVVLAPHASTYYASFRSPPRVAMYSRFIDTDVNTTPVKLLVNGTNSLNPDAPGNIGLGGVSVMYKSITNGSGVWGIPARMYPYGGLLGNLQIYTAYDNTGADRGVARGYLITLIIDESQTAIFQDSDSTFSTATSYSFWYHPNAGKRLRGGATFTGESLQGLDAPPN